jgi:hypothetical protein
MTTNLLLLFSEKGIAGGKNQITKRVVKGFRASLKSAASLDKQ